MANTIKRSLLYCVFFACQTESSTKRTRIKILVATAPSGYVLAAMDIPVT